jgi:putative addiction module killer protein
MIEIRKTDTFAKWIDGLHDIRARARILVRIERLTTGNPGDVKKVYPKCGSIMAQAIGYILKR